MVGRPTPIQTDEATALCVKDQAGSQVMDPEEEGDLRAALSEEGGTANALEPKLMEDTVPALRKPPAREGQELTH